jgi:hypothetical protein
MKHLALLLLLAALNGCAVTGEPVTHRIQGETHQINAEVNGRTFTATVFMDGQPVLNHTWPPLVNSRDEKEILYRGHRIRSVLRIIKGFGSTNAQIYVYVDGEQAGEFFF